MSSSTPKLPADNNDPSIPLLSQDELGQTQSAIDPVSTAAQNGQTLDEPPIYQHPFFGNGKEDCSERSQNETSRAQHVSEVIATPLYASSTVNELAWYETLRELQANIADLKIARERASRYSKLAWFVPRGSRPRNAVNIEQEVRVLEELVAAGMRRLSRIHPDPLVQAEWDSRAETFFRSLSASNGDIDTQGSIVLGDAEGAISIDLEGARGQRVRRQAIRLLVPSEKDSIVMGITKGFAIVLCTPVILSAAAVFGAGAILYGSGKIIIGLGHVATCGKLR